MGLNGTHTNNWDTSSSMVIKSKPIGADNTFNNAAYSFEMMDKFSDIVIGNSMTS